MGVGEGRERQRRGERGDGLLSSVGCIGALRECRVWTVVVLRVERAVVDHAKVACRAGLSWYDECQV